MKTSPSDGIARSKWSVMGKKVKIKLNSAGIKELLKSSEIEAACREQAEAVVQRAGDGYKANSFVGKNRVNVSVSADTPEARKDNLENNTLLKALGG